jgi:hypothetical protein
MNRREIIFLYVLSSLGFLPASLWSIEYLLGSRDIPSLALSVWFFVLTIGTLIILRHLPRETS